MEALQQRNDDLVEHLTHERERIQREAGEERERIQHDAADLLRELTQRLKSMEQTIAQQTQTIDGARLDMRDMGQQMQDMGQQMRAMVRVGNDVSRDLKKLKSGFVASGRIADAVGTRALTSGVVMNFELSRKSKASTMRLDCKKSGFMLLTKPMMLRNSVTVRCVSGDQDDVSYAVGPLEHDGYNLESKDFEANANPSDFLNNVRIVGAKFVRDRVSEYNEELREQVWMLFLFLFKGTFDTSSRRPLYAMCARE